MVMILSWIFRTLRGRLREENQEFRIVTMVTEFRYMLGLGISSPPVEEGARERRPLILNLISRCAGEVFRSPFLRCLNPISACSKRFSRFVCCTLALLLLAPHAGAQS